MKFATDQTIADFDAAIFRYLHPAIIEPQRYKDNLVKIRAM